MNKIKNFQLVTKYNHHEIYDAHDVARYIIDYSNKQNYNISNLKLQKLLFFVQAAFLIEKKQPCFNNEIIAWDIGPVVPDVWHNYNQFGGENIYCVFDEDTFCNEDKSLIEEVIDSFKNYSSCQLTKLTQGQRPWKSSYNHYQNHTISNESIYDYFHSKIE